MKPTELKYPVLCHTKYGFSCLTSADRLTIGFVKNLRTNYYTGLVIIDSDGVRYRVTQVAQCGWVGPFWGFSLLYSRRARLTMDLVPDQKQPSVAQVKEQLLTDFEKSPEWSARGDLDNLRRSVEASESIADVIRSICFRHQDSP